MIWTDIWSFFTLTGPPGRNYESHALKYMYTKNVQGKVNFNLKLFSLDLFQHTVKTSYLEQNIILGSGDIISLIQ